MELTALASTPDGAAPLLVSKRAWAYPSFCVVSNGSFSQTFPVTVKLTDGNGQAGDTRTIRFAMTGTLAPFTTLPADFELLDDGTPSDVQSIVVNTTALAPGTYTLSVRAFGSQIFGKVKTLSITVVVGDSCVGSFVSFYSDPALTALVDCEGFDVTLPTGGTFQIEPTGANASTVLATHPATFVYSFIWTNTTDASIDTVLDLSSTGFVPAGPDAVRAMTFETATFSADTATFQTVTTSGTSCGATGPCPVTVGVGETAWFTWAGTWEGVGGSTAGLSSVCPGNATLSTTATLSTGGTSIAVAAGSASGYLVPCAKADVNGDGTASVGDVFYLINYLFAQGPAPSCGSGDVNGDAVTDVSDVFYYINYLFAEGPAPV